MAGIKNDQQSLQGSLKHLASDLTQVSLPARGGRRTLAGAGAGLVARALERWCRLDDAGLAIVRGLRGSRAWWSLQQRHPMATSGGAYGRLMDDGHVYCGGWSLEPPATASYSLQLQVEPRAATV